MFMFFVFFDFVKLNFIHLEENNWERHIIWEYYAIVES